MAYRWYGVLQTDDLDAVFESARAHLMEGTRVRIERVVFGEASREHAAVEFELYAELEEIE